MRVNLTKVALGPALLRRPATALCKRGRGAAALTARQTLLSSAKRVEVYTVKKIYRFSRPQPGCH
jgi:hypothetical protein